MLKISQANFTIIDCKMEKKILECTKRERQDTKEGGKNGQSEKRD